MSKSESTEYATPLFMSKSELAEHGLLYLLRKVLYANKMMVYITEEVKKALDFKGFYRQRVGHWPTDLDRRRLRMRSEINISEACMYHVYRSRDLLC
jgi:hypothetical protein